MTKKKQSFEQDDDSFRDLIKKRGVIKGKLTLFAKFVESLVGLQLTNIQKAELQVRSQKVELLFQQFSDIQDSIDLKVDDHQIDKELQERAAFEDQYYGTVAKAKCMSDDKEHEVQVSTQKSCIKMPTISLPSFDGSLHCWLEFRDTYMSLIHNSKNIDNVQKFHYLRSALTGNALQVIKSLEFSAENYVTAWELLENRYNNNRLLVHNHVKALFSIQSINQESFAAIRKLIDSVMRNIRALKTLGEPTESWDTLIIYIIASKLDSSTEREWELNKGTILKSDGNINTKIALSDMLNFLKDRADVLETIKASHCTRNSALDTNKKQPSQINTHSYVATHHNNNKSSNSNTTKRSFVVPTCVMCDAKHALYSCSSFLNLPKRDKYKFINEKSLCPNCLRAGHDVTGCWFGSCKKCNKKHNTVLHSDCDDTSGASSSSVAHNTQESPAPQSRMSADSGRTTTLHTTSHSDNTRYDGLNNNITHSLSATVLLSTALVEIADNDDKYHTIRAILDCGSEQCFISQSLCNKLKIPLIQSTVHVTGVGNSVTQSTQSCNIQLRSKTSDYNTRLNCLVLPHITAQLSSLSIRTRTDIQIPEHITLADSEFHSPTQVQLLIGANRFWELMNDGLIRLNNGPYLQNTKLGWIISGSLLNSKNRSINRVQCNHSQTLDTQLKQFWELEEIQSVTKYTKEDSACETLFETTTLRDDSGRFAVRIPLSESADALGDTFAGALNRFHALERKLSRCAPSYKQLYVDFMREYLSLGHMSLIRDYSKPYFFLPHHGVFKEHSLTTRLRVVFDASFNPSPGNKKSLNSIQFTGPALQNDIFSILLRFRQFKYVACADVEKMYRQILIQPDQRNLQLIFWREDPSQPLNVYQLNTLTYGTSSAPYLSQKCLKTLSSECTDDVIAQVIDEDFYVDDLITGHDSKDRLLEICNGVSEVLKSGCFPLRKWVFNSDTPACLSPSSKDLSLGDSNNNNSQTKTLGLSWLYTSDELHFNTSFNQETTRVTKRLILSVISQIFDPLGLLAPAIVIAKILLQKTWLCKIGWDDPVPSNIHKHWQAFVGTLQYLQQLRVPRHVKGEHLQHTELHIFTDASQDAYGACAYIRTYSDDSAALITVNLLCAKSKVAPVKPVSVPRLELCGALVGAKLYAKIIKSLRLDFSKIYFWTDSTIVIGWLQSTPRSLKTFVQNRVVEINELTGDSPWLHCMGKNNPSDLLTRGVTFDALNNSDLWWRGPSFLREVHSDWSQSHNVSINVDELPELKSNTVAMVCQSKAGPPFPFERFSSYNRLRRATGYVLRFIDNTRTKLKSQRKVGPLSVDELSNSTKVLARMAQQQSLLDVYNALVNNLPLKAMRNISGLDVFLDRDNLIRVGGRLNNTESISFDKKHPILLGPKHTFSRLLFQHEHKRLLHAGPQLLLASIRDSWWPLRGRDLARQTVHSCVTCTRITGRTLSVKMGNLPASRIEPGFPFIRCGVDYAGPLLILNRKGRGARLEKCYICLFVCFVTKAIHLELVTSLTTQGYLLAVKRFCSRRGKPLEIFSDNGKTFVGAMKDLSQFLSQSSDGIVALMANDGIKLTFIPPYAPHFGGLWEAGVRSCKNRIRRVIGNAHLTYEEFSTVLAQIEAVLNSRPISPLSTDPNDLLPLSPAHFLIGRPLTAPPCGDLTSTATHRLARYDRVEQLRQQFWKRWSTEYISELQTRTKWQTTKEDITPNTLVLIKEDNLPPLKWRLGRVLQTYPGKDNISRVATIKTAAGVIQRAFSKICPLLHESEEHKQ